MDKVISINQNYLKLLNKLAQLLYSRLKVYSRDNPGERNDILTWQINNPLYDELSFNSQIEAIESKIEEIKEEACKQGVEIPLEKLCEKHNLSKDEKTILIILFFNKMTDITIRGSLLLKLISSDIGELIAKSQIISPKGKLRSLCMIRSDEKGYFAYKPSIYRQDFEISHRLFWLIAGNEELGENEDGEIENEQRLNGKLLWVKEPEVSFKHLVLADEIMDKIKDALWQYEHGKLVYALYGLNEKIPYGQPVAMLFYGPPGTGKTATGEAIAQYLGKKIGIVNYAQIYNCFVGESEKNILKAFTEAKRDDCILLFDEADSLFAQRVNEGRSVDRMYNTMTNLLMQKLEKFSGMIILTTNREVVIDKAFERRLLLKLNFELPSAEMRSKIWEAFLKDCPRIVTDVNFEELGRYSLSGGKIKNSVVRTVMRCAKVEKTITMADLIQSATEEVTSELGKEKEIGF